MTNIKKIHSSIHDYDLHYEDKIDFLVDLVRDESAFFIIDKNIYDLYNHYFLEIKDKEKLFILEAIEENKTLASAEHVFDKLIATRPTKKTKIISIGGGITQDVSGYVASTFYRGLHWIYVPTTLLAQADSCMGSKTSLNYKSFKNILGTFYPPHHIYLCADFVKTLHEIDYYSGMGEVVKLHAMGGRTELDKLIQRIPAVHDRKIEEVLFLIKSSLENKWKYMEHDEFDQGIRNMLNYGHCFGHAIETATHYAIPHGQAVIIGMIMSNMVAVDKKILSTENSNRMKMAFEALLKCDLKLILEMDVMDVINAMKQDKKRVGTGLPLIMINDEYILSKTGDLTEEEALNTIAEFKKAI